MANKKISELESRASLSLSDLMAVGDPSTGYLYKTTISDLKTLTGAGVVSFNGRFGTVNPAEGDYTLTQLGDVIITSPSNGQVLKFNGSNWVNASDVVEADTLDTVTGRGNTTANSITVGSVSAAGLSNLLGQIRTFVTTGNTYIGANPTSATDAGFKLDVNGTTRLNGAASVTGVLTGSDTIRSTNGTVTASISYGSTAGIIGTTSNHSLELRTNNTYRVGISTAGVVNIANLIGTGSRIVVADAAGNLSASSALTGYVTLDTAQTITGEKIFSTAIGAVGGISLRDTVGGSNYGGIVANSSYFQISAQSGSAILIKASDGTNALTIGTTGNTLMTNVTATSFIKSGGTSSQFLKADGSVDSNTYATTSSLSSYLPLSGGTLTGGLSGTSATLNAGLTLNRASAGAANGYVLQTAGTSNWYIGSSAVGANSDFQVYNHAATAVVFNIANTTGAATFSSSVTVNGNNVTIQPTTTTTYALSVMQNAGGYLRVGRDTSTGALYGDAYAALVMSSGAYPLIFGTNDSERMRISSNGNVGIGTTSPSEKLFVSNSGGSTGIGIQTITSGDPYLRLYDNTTVKADLWWDRPGNFMGINSTGSGSKTCINAYGGQVGIGTTAPLTTFTVKSTNDNGYALTRPSDASSYHWRLSTTETGGDAYTTRYNTFNNEMLFTTYASGGTGGNIIWRTGASGGGSETERMRITPAGRMGLGTSSPDAQLHVVGNQINAKTGNGGTYKQTVVGQTTAAASGSSKKLAYVSHTHSVRVYVWANQSTGNGSSAIADIVTLYGSSNGGTVMESNFGNVSDISITYDNGGSPGYTINVSLTYSGAAPTINFVIEGVSHDNNIYTL